MDNQFYKNVGFSHSRENVFFNSSRATLVEHAIKNTGARLSKNGSLVVTTGKHTGRAAKDKYVVMSAKTESSIDWRNNIHKMNSSTFESIKNEVISCINKSKNLYHSNYNVGALEKYSIEAELFSTHPSHSLFFAHMMRNDEFPKFGLGKFTIYHAPTLNLDSTKYDLRSETCIAMDMDKNEVVIAGTLYAGEIKKSLFSAMNYILPAMNLLPMHAGSNVAQNGDVSVFFGLSGTGKTTLSTQEGRLLIGDDEHGLSDDGIFNFEGGCYAKTYKLSKTGEPGIYKASNRFGNILENVVIDENGVPDFDDKTLAENGRSAYPLDFIEGIEKSSTGKVPNHMFFLTADAFGVLPPVSQLDQKQAMYYFLSGYTAKLAGTEVGITEPQATFSTCFGAPFMMRPAKEYAKLLGDYIEKHNIKVWLVNTGWTKGSYGVGHRFPLNVTRAIVDAIQSNELNDCEYTKENFFGLSIPSAVKGVDASLLNPRDTWANKAEYDKLAQELGKMFQENFKRFENMPTSIIQGGPRA